VIAPEVPVMDAGLAAVLDDRYRRQDRRCRLTIEYARTLVQLTMVVPGQRKDGPEISEAARLGAARLEAVLEGRALAVLHRESWNGAAGPCFMWVLEAGAALVKGVTVGLEDGYSLGRLWDFDVYDGKGSKLDREAVGSATRTCFVCGSPAAICAGRRLHGSAEVVWRFTGILERGMAELKKKGDIE